ncbi:hypothetical protein SAMN04489844_0799 [Nocardioides exalbidus]|uniref:Uncharacterized protein n=1 Tax=Nocardioides exalbidus TaxID=402596 RepID=A0A1H4L794_9ACTN|nr:hypothetical protein [Nocardioides exalbidus]SEB66627.1 hypothetical protein SAMN04489844_0799 [Nocardioides exalbidus]
MKQRRFRAVTALLSVLALSAVAAPAHAGDRGGDRGDGPRHSQHGHGGGHGWGHGHGHSRGTGMTVTEEVTAILDAASVEVEGSNGARVGRDDDDLLVISVGGRHRGHWNDDSDDDDDERDDRRGKDGSRGGDGSNAVVTFTGTTVTSEWTDFDVDVRDGVVTAEVDGVEDVPVLTIVKADDDDDDRGRARRGGSHDLSLEYQLTEESAVVLGAVVGADAFEAGDVFATAGGCGR